MLYIPILRAKTGEAEALAALKPETRALIRPLLQIPPPNIIVPKANERRTQFELEEQRDIRYIKKFAANLEMIQGEDGMFYYLDASTSRLSLGMLETMLTPLREHRRPPYPVIYLTDSLDFWRLYFDLFGPPNSVLLRIRRREIAELDTPQQVDDLLERFSLAATEVILLIDGEDVSDSDVGMDALSVAALASSLGARGNVTLAFAGGAYPSNPKNPTNAAEPLRPWQPYLFPRKDLDIWKRVKQRIDSPIIYSDYAASPAGNAPNVQRTPAPKVRYTLDTHFLLYKGTTSAAEDISHDEQYRRISRYVYSHPQYPGSSFSWGDNHIFHSQSTLSHRRGNAQKWVTVSTSHHIEWIIATLASSS